jgi:hypothetical protein
MACHIITLFSPTNIKIFSWKNMNFTLNLLISNHQPSTFRYFLWPNENFTKFCWSSIIGHQWSEMSLGKLKNFLKTRRSLTIDYRRYLLVNFNTSPNSLIPNQWPSAIKDVFWSNFNTSPNSSIPDHQPSLIFVGKLQHLYDFGQNPWNLGRWSPSQDDLNRWFSSTSQTDKNE